jgi:hypothetical protein
MDVVAVSPGRSLMTLSDAAPQGYRMAFGCRCLAGRRLRFPAAAAAIALWLSVPCPELARLEDQAPSLARRLSTWE